MKMRALLTFVIMMSACSEQAEPDPLAAAQKRLSAAMDAGDKAGRCRAANEVADIYSARGEQRNYEWAAAEARLLCG